jgi:hypothetical protein
VSDGFPEGCDTANLQEASVLLLELTSARITGGWLLSHTGASQTQAVHGFQMHRARADLFARPLSVDHRWLV